VALSVPEHIDEDVGVTRAMAAEYLTEAGVTPHMISVWGKRGWVTPNGQRRHLTVVGTTPRGQMLFRYGDILDAEGDTRSNPNSSRSAVRRMAAAT